MTSALSIASPLSRESRQTCGAFAGMTSALLRSRGFSQREPGLDDRIGVERDALDLLLDQPLREVGMIGGSLPADARILAGLAAGGDRHREHRLHRIVTLIEGRRDRASGVAIDGERELR